MELTLNGKATWQGKKSGTYANNNVIDQYGAPALFNNFTVVNGTVTALDLRLKGETPAVGTGNPTDAPTVDIAGATRTIPDDLGAYKYSAAKPYSGTLTLVANARQIGQPQFQISVDGNPVGTAYVTANGGARQVGVYTVAFTTPAAPKVIDITLVGFLDTVTKYDGVGLFNVKLGKVPLDVENAKIISGNIVLKDGADFLTNGSTLQFNVSKD